MADIVIAIFPCLQLETIFDIAEHSGLYRSFYCGSLRTQVQLENMFNGSLVAHREDVVEAVFGSEDDFWDEVVHSVRAEYLSEAQDYPWIIGFSGGKDSTVVAQTVFEAMLQVAPSQRKRHVHFVSNDTQVESPLVMAHLAKVQAAIASMAESFRLPVTVVTTRPAPDKTFWTLLIGKGYPSPNQTMRWCTDP